MDGVPPDAVGVCRMDSALQLPPRKGQNRRQCDPVLRVRSDHPPRHPPLPHARDLRRRPHPLRRACGRAAAAGALPGDADERLSLLPAGADAVQRPAAKVAPLAPHFPHDADRLHPQRGDRVRAVPLRPRHGGDGRRDLQHAGDVRRRNIAAAGPRHGKTQGKAHDHDPDCHRNAISAYRQDCRLRRGAAHGGRGLACHIHAGKPAEAAAHPLRGRPQDACRRGERPRCSRPSSGRSSGRC